MSEREAPDHPVAAEMRNVVYERTGQRLIDGLTLVLPTEGCTVLMGPNGAGKSLALRLLAGLVAPSKGTIRRLGAANAGFGTAYVAQRPVLLRRSTRANLIHALRLRGISRATCRRRADDLLALGHLGKLADTPARRLSGGEQQRLSIIRALTSDPALLLLDEPTAALDPQSTAAIEALIATSKSKGVKTVLVTHDAGQARRMADDVAFMMNGRVVEHRPAADFFDASSPEVSRYLKGELLL